MAANDYVFEAGLQNVYLAKKIDNQHFMSQDRRLVSNYEIIGLFEWYLRKFCVANKSQMLNITDENNEVIFEVTIKGKLLDEVKEEINADK